jgi:hypothetical protein
MHLAPGRVAGMVADATARNTHITCHTHIAHRGHQGADIVCAGWHASHPYVDLAHRAAGDLRRPRRAHRPGHPAARRAVRGGGRVEGKAPQPLPRTARPQPGP